MAAPSAASARQEGQPFAKAATMRDVAERANVSVASVSRVLNGLGVTSDATRQRVLDAVEDLRYVPHFGARSLSTSKTTPADCAEAVTPDAPMATPTSAAASAGASLMPSPTISVGPLRQPSCTKRTLSCGERPE